MFTSEVLDLGVRDLFAFPLTVDKAANIGVLELYRTRPGPLETPHYRIATDYAATLGLTLVDELDPTRTSSPMLDPALFPPATSISPQECSLSNSRSPPATPSPDYKQWHTPNTAGSPSLPTTSSPTTSHSTPTIHRQHRQANAPDRMQMPQLGS